MTKLRRWLSMAVLSFAGGAIFLLPFLQEVYYKPLATALSLNNTQVGSLMSVFGLTAMLSYFPGGWLADRWSSRKLITASLLTTGGLGVYFATFPSYGASLAIHGVWGVTITLLFWSAMIRVTRNWAPAEEQGRAFGILETGRGIGEGVSSVAFWAVFGWLGSTDKALSIVVIQLSVLLIILGVLSWFVLEDDNRNSEVSETPKIGINEVLQVLRLPVVWLIAIVILTGYCAYWGTFRFTPYATDIFLMSVTLAGGLSIAKMFLKPFGALIAGFVSDKLGISKSLAYLFGFLTLSFGLFAFIPGLPKLLPLMLISVALISLATFAIRGIYFALLEEGNIPMAVTGTAAGIVSVVGFTPDIFMPLLGGMLIDQFPGPQGYRYFFLATGVICAMGLAASLLILKYYVKPKNH